LHAGVTLVLADEIDVSRGDLIVRDDSVPELRRNLSATVCWLGGTPLDMRRKYLLRHTTREVRARVDRIDYLWDVATQQREPAPPSLAMNDIAQIGLTLAQPVFPDRYAENRATGSFILIDEATNNTVAAGLVA
jgi:sulfate adenylyltransferase subunit 1